jgi:hypothetical protein
LSSSWLIIIWAIAYMAKSAKIGTNLIISKKVIGIKEKVAGKI